MLYWTPRLLAILFAVFVSMFAVDVFGEGLGFWRTVGALLIHLVPAGVILGILALAWQRDGVGVAYVALGIGYIGLARGRFPGVTDAVVSGPLFLIGVMFLVNWLRRPSKARQPRPHRL